MFKFVQEAIKDNDARWFLEDIVVPERETVCDGGNTWILDDIIVTRDDVNRICRDRVVALVKILPGSTKLELEYLKDSINHFKGFIEWINAR
ncbi:MAG: hypothetical protein ACYSTS_00575 [Planctomycetota bacterium]|jgi:hypothetical protein